jgi:alpha-1,6-mannosyltransferase
MHIVQLANFYGPNTGGLRVALDELARRYAAAGHRCTLIVPADRDAVEHDPAGRTTIMLRSPRVPRMPAYRVITRRAAVDRALTQLAPDVIELSDKLTLCGPASRARRDGVPVVLFSHERLDHVVSGVVRIAGARLGVRAYNRRLASDADAIVCASHYAAAEFAGLHHRIEHVPLAVDLDRFRPAGGEVVSRGPGRIVTVVRLSPEKRPQLVVDTVRELVRRGEQIEATVYGDGPLRSRLTEDARGLPIYFAGYLRDREELARQVAAADVAIAPGPFETFGLAALEVLACGTPVVVPASGALPEMLGPGCGVSAPADPHAFADAVQLLLRGDRGVHRSRARARAEEFSWDRSAEGFLRVFGSLAGDRTEQRRPAASGRRVA